jgi:hypothetical protein
MNISPKDWVMKKNMCDVEPKIEGQNIPYLNYYSLFYTINEITPSFKPKS